MPTIERRVAALEQRNGPTNQIGVIIRTVVSEDPGAELQTAVDYEGGSWVRLPHEDEDEFLDRACREAQRGPGGVARLLVTS